MLPTRFPYIFNNLTRTHYAHSRLPAHKGSQPRQKTLREKVDVSDLVLTSNWYSYDPKVFSWGDILCFNEKRHGTFSE